MKDVWYIHDIDMVTTSVEEALKYKKRTNLTSKIEDLQRQLDWVMLEYCPQEMSVSQLKNWVESQKPEGISIGGC